jgi:hypothetical protein
MRKSWNSNARRLPKLSVEEEDAAEAEVLRLKEEEEEATLTKKAEEEPADALRRKEEE